MLRRLILWWGIWSSQRHPNLLLVATGCAVIVALLLMIGMGNAPVTLYKEF